MKQITGAITAIVTPFNTDLSVDQHALKAFIQFQLEGGVSGIVPCGSTGEAATMHMNEYFDVIKTTVDTVKKKVPVIAGAGSNDTAKAVELSLLAKKAGADALLHVTPFYNKPTPKGLIAHYEAIADATNMPIILYTVPGRTGLNVPPEVLLQIIKNIPHVVGVKEASGNIAQIMEIIAKVPADFSVLSGDDSLTLPVMSLGGHGCISVVANEVPEKFSQLVAYGMQGDFTNAKKIHFSLLELMNINFIETNPIPVKTALAMMGKMKEVFRLPLVSMEEKNKQILRTILKEGKLL